MNILQEIAAYAGERVAEAKKKVTLEEMKKRALRAAAAEKQAAGGNADPDCGDAESEYCMPPFEAALKKDGLSFILECKKASPSKGIIAEEFDYLNIAKDYEAAGADAISVLTEPKWFLGRNEYLAEIASAVKIPVLRKDFVVDEYMIYEAKVLGASAVLLIVSILTPEQIKEYLGICRELGLSALVEAHDEAEVLTAVECGAKIIGVNNRNLKDFSVDMENAGKLRRLIPGDVAFVSESGVKTPEDIKVIKEFGASAVLIGETVMRAENKSRALAMLKGE